MTRNVLIWLHSAGDRSAQVGATLLLRSLVLLPVLSAARPAEAQQRGETVRVLAGSALRGSPGGAMVGVLSRTFDAPVELVQGSAVRLRLQGFVHEQQMRIEANRSRAVIGGTGSRGAAGGTLRIARGEAEPVLATLQRGAAVFPGEKSGTFLAVNRVVWVDKSRLAKFTAAVSAKAPDRQPARPATTPSPAKPVTVAPPATPAPTPLPIPASPPLLTTAATALRSAPDGNDLFTLPRGALVTATGVENGWTRVRVEGWVATRDLASAGAKAVGELSAADLRADPAGLKGRIVRWTVEALSYQLGDGLRRELNGEPYLLARGPGKERAILYLAVPDSLVQSARSLAPLSVVTVTARVRNGRSQPGGVPILDVLELVRP